MPECCCCFSTTSGLSSSLELAKSPISCAADFSTSWGTSDRVLLAIPGRSLRNPSFRAAASLSLFAPIPRFRRPRFLPVCSCSTNSLQALPQSRISKAEAPSMSAGGSIGSFGISTGSCFTGDGGLYGCCSSGGCSCGESNAGIGVYAFMAPLERKCDGGNAFRSIGLLSSSDISELVCLRSWLLRCSFSSKLLRSLEMTDWSAPRC